MARRPVAVERAAGDEDLHPDDATFSGCPGHRAAWAVAVHHAALLLMGATWVETKVPAFGVQAALRNWGELDHLFRAVLLRSGTFVALLTGAVVLGDVALYHGESLGLWRVAEPLLGAAGLDVLKHLPAGDDQPLIDPLSLALLAVATVALHVIAAQTAYLRAHVREPLLRINLGLGVAVTATLALTGWLGSVRTMVVGYTACVLLVGLGGGTWVFLLPSAMACVSGDIPVFTDKEHRICRAVYVRGRPERVEYDSAVRTPAPELTMRSLLPLILSALALAHTPGGGRAAEPEDFVIRVTTAYPGASARVVADTIAAPLEQQINGVEGMTRIESESRDDGSYTLTVYSPPGPTSLPPRSWSRTDSASRCRSCPNFAGSRG